MSTIASLDDTDRTLLALLREDGRASTAALARRLSLSRTTVQSRIDRLVKWGVVAGFTARLGDAYELALVRAHVLITVPPRHLARLERDLRAITEVRTLHSVSGGFDLIAVVAAPSIRELDALIDRIGVLEGVERTQSAIVLSTRIDR